MSYLHPVQEPFFVPKPGYPHEVYHILPEQPPSNDVPQTGAGVVVSTHWLQPTVALLSIGTLLFVVLAMTLINARLLKKLREFQNGLQRQITKQAIVAKSRTSTSCIGGELAGVTENSTGVTVPSSVDRHCNNTRRTFTDLEASKDERDDGLARMNVDDDADSTIGPSITRWLRSPQKEYVAVGRLPDISTTASVESFNTSSGSPHNFPSPASPKNRDFFCARHGSACSSSTECWRNFGVESTSTNELNRVNAVYSRHTYQETADRRYGQLRGKGSRFPPLPRLPAAPMLVSVRDKHHEEIINDLNTIPRSNDCSSVLCECSPSFTDSSNVSDQFNSCCAQHAPSPVYDYSLQFSPLPAKASGDKPLPTPFGKGPSIQLDETGPKHRVTLAVFSADIRQRDVPVLRAPLGLPRGGRLRLPQVLRQPQTVHICPSLVVERSKSPKRKPILRALSLEQSPEPLCWKQPDNGAGGSVADQKLPIAEVQPSLTSERQLKETDISCQSFGAPNHSVSLAAEYFQQLDTDSHLLLGLRRPRAVRGRIQGQK